MENKKNILFIGGTGRSGTTILKKTLSQHPEIIGLPEWRATIDPHGLIQFYLNQSNGWSPFVYDSNLKLLRKTLYDVGNRSVFNTALLLFLQKTGIKIPNTKYKITSRYHNIKMKKHCPDYFLHVEKLIDDLHEFKYKGHWLGMEFGEKNEIFYSPPGGGNDIRNAINEFLVKVINDAVKKKNATHYLDDNTWNPLWFSSLLEILPEARLIHIHRDPRDVVASFMGQTWTPVSVDHNISFYKGLMKQWREEKVKLPRESFLELRLEDVVKNKKETLLNIVEFCGLKWDDALLEINLSKSNSGRWKNDFSKEDQKILNQRLEEELKVLGYA